MKKLTKILFAITIGSGALIWAIQIAYIQRGYQAYGGEYIFSLLVTIATYCIVNKLDP